MPMAGFRVGPVVALDYAKAEVDGYTESGDAALTLNVSDMNYSSLTGSLGIEARGDFAGGGVQLRPFAAAAIEKDFSGDGRTVHFAQTSAPTIVNSWAYDDRSKKAYARLSGGASAAILSECQPRCRGVIHLRQEAGRGTLRAPRRQGRLLALSWA